MTTTAARSIQTRSVSRRAWLITTLLFLFMLLNFADKAVLGFAGVHIQRDLGISPQQFGLLQSSFFWLFAVGAIVLGALSSRISLRWLLSGLMLVWVLTMIPLLGTVSFGVLLASRIILGFAEGPAAALATHCVQSWFPAHKRGVPLGITTSGAAVGPLLAAPIMTWIIATWSWHAAFGVLVVSGSLWALAWLIFGKDAPAEVLQESSSESNSPGTSSGSGPLVDISLRTVLTSGTVIGVGLLLFFSYWSTTLKVAWLPVYLSDGLGYNTLTTGRLIMIPYAVAAVASMTVGLISNKLIARGASRRVARGYLAGGLIVIAGLAMAGFTTLAAGWPQIVLITVAFSANTAAYVVAFAAIGDVVHPRKRGTVLGCIVAFYSMAGIIAPLLLGYLVGNAADKISGYQQGFMITGVLMAVGGAAATLLVRPDLDVAKFAKQAAKQALPTSR